MDKFYKRKKKYYYPKQIDYKQNSNSKNKTVKFCVFAGRQKNIQILHQYIKLLLNESIINEYHIFDFTRNLQDKHYLYKSYLDLKNDFKYQIYLHNYNNDTLYVNNQYDWSPFYKTISNPDFYTNSVIIKCDDDILFIDVYGLKNAIQNRIEDKKSFLIHSNCINNNICSYYHKSLFKSIENNLSYYPQGGILGPIFENPVYGYIMQFEFLKDCLSDYKNLYNYYFNDIYLNTRISINFILINGEDCKYFKNVKYDDEYELSSYYPEKLLRPNKIIGNFLTCHYSYSIQEKIMLRKRDLLQMYHRFYNFYLDNFKKNNYVYQNRLINSIKVNKIGKNKFYIHNFLDGLYEIYTKDGYYLYMNYNDDNLQLSEKEKSYFKIENDNNIITISLGIYFFNRYNLMDSFKNRNLLIKFLSQKDENLIQLIPKDNCYYLQFLKSKLFINVKNNKIDVSNESDTLWNFNQFKINKSNKKIFVKRYSYKNKFYYKNLHNDYIYTNFYLGWGCENIIKIK